MTFQERSFVHLLRFKQWWTHHGLEVILAVVCAVLAGVLIAVIVPPSAPGPFNVYFLAFKYYGKNDSSAANAKIFAKLREMDTAKGLTIGEAAVHIKLDEILNELDGSNNVALATSEAEKLIALPDTLLVISQLESDSTQAALPIYFENTHQPPVPFIATAETDDQLLANCKHECRGDQDFIPLLQLPPTNKQQGESAVRFAIQNKKTHFAIVTDTSDPNKTYVDGMVRSYKNAIELHSGLHQDGEIRLVGPPEQAVTDVNRAINGGLPKDANCILYAGQLGAAGELLKKVFDPERSAETQPMVILPDYAVRPNIFGYDVAEPIVSFMDFRDADDWNNESNSFVLDAFEIAGQLINDLNRTGNRWFRMKSKLHWEDVQDARIDLVRIMKENSASRVSYRGWSISGTPNEDTATYVFQNHKNVQAIYHAWKPEPEVKDVAGMARRVKMDDVDHWHKPKIVAQPIQSTLLVTPQDR